MELFEDYLRTIEDSKKRTSIQKVLNWVKDTFPNLESKIAWNQPMFTDHGTFIIGFSIAKQHFSISPETKTIEVFSEEIEKAGYTKGSNIFRIKWTDSIDFSLLKRMIQYNIEDKMDCPTFWRS